MRRSAMVLGCALALAGCMEGTVPIVTGGSAGPESRKLSSGMTRAQADAVYGRESGFERNPANWDESCVSYAYGSEGAPRHVHAVFRDGRLLRATDGHAEICTYGAAL